jgi:hypothetical protein
MPRAMSLHIAWDARIAAVATLKHDWLAGLRP